MFQTARYLAAKLANLFNWYTYDYPQASPCSNVLIYTRSGNEVSMLVTERDPSVGAGRSLGAGGFDEVKGVLKAVQDDFKKAGQMFDGVAETYREMWEELGEDIKTIIPYEDFKRRVEYLWDGLVPRKNYPLVEKVVMRTLEVTQDEMDAIMALPPTQEQIGKKLERFTLNDDGNVPANSQIVEQVLTGFKYPHEVEAAKMWFERQEQRAKARLSSTGPGW